MTMFLVISILFLIVSTTVASNITGCDKDSFLQDCDIGSSNCLLSNGRYTGSCCTTQYLCLEGEGDCDSDDDCYGSLLCGTNNCDSVFAGTHDCCESGVDLQYPYALHTGNKNKMNWTNANAFCADTYGTTLATIHTDSEAQQILNMTLASDCADSGVSGTLNIWIGLNDLAVQGTYEWVSGEACDGDCLDLEWWHPNQPSSGRQRCVCIRHNSQNISELFNDGDCPNSLCFFCDLPPTASPTSQPTSAPTLCHDFGGEDSYSGTAESLFDVGLLDLNQHIDTMANQSKLTYYMANESAKFLSESIRCNESDSHCIIECSALAACLSSTIYVGVDGDITTNVPTMEPTTEPSLEPTTNTHPTNTATISPTAIPTMEPTFVPSAVHGVAIFCNETASCFDANVVSSKLQYLTNITIICNAENACNAMKIDVVDFLSFNVYCGHITACDNMVINITITDDADEMSQGQEAGNYGSITCSAPNACDGLHVTTTSNKTLLSMFEWSDGVIFDNGFGFVDNIECNNDRYIKYRNWINETEDTITESILAEYEGDHFPCDGIQVLCDGASCDMEYSLRSLDYNDSVDCYWLNVQDIQNLKCLGDCVNSPTSPPTASPTSSPTLPTADPTKNPSIDPTTDPTFDPTSDPTEDPTGDPTTDPTFDPSIDPTTEPTIVPSWSPTAAPSFSPSFAPTRYPTVYPIYDGYIEMEYSLHNLSTENKMTLWEDVDSVVPEMKVILEKSYLEMSSGQLEYREFGLRIDSINGVDISDFISTNAESGSKTLYNALDVSNFFQLPVTLDATIDILQTSASLVVDNSNQEFAGYAAIGFRELFNNSYISFSVDTASSEMVVIDKSATAETVDNTALIIAVTILSVGAVVSLVAKLWDKSSKTSSDDSSFMSPLFIAIHLYDFASDIILCCKIGEAASDDGIDLYSTYLWLTIASVSTIVVPLLLNTWYAVRIQQQTAIQGNPAARVWFGARFAIFVSLSLFTSGTYPVLKLVNSRIFGLEIFGAGLLSSELRELSKIKIRCTIFFENIPQLFIQIVFLMLDKVQIETILAMVSSLLSVAAALVIYFGEKDIEDEYKIAKYFLYLSTKNAVMSDEAKAAMESNKKKRAKLRVALTTIFGSGTKKLIEVGSVTMKDDGIAVHIQHLVFKEELERHKRNTNRYNISEDDYLNFCFRSNTTVGSKIEKVFNAMWTHYGLEGTAERKDKWGVRYQLELDIDQNPRLRLSVVSYSTDGYRCASRTGSPQAVVLSNPEPPSSDVQMVHVQKQSEPSVGGSVTGWSRQTGAVEGVEEDVEVVVREMVGRLTAVLERRAPSSQHAVQNSTLSPIFDSDIF